MEEGKRQKQIGGLLQQELNDLFQRMGMSMMDGGMVSISTVKVTPDLLEARIYLSLFKVTDAEATMKKIEDRAWEVKRELAARVKHHLRRIPELRFYRDDTLDHVFKMEKLFDEIKEKDQKRDDENTEEN